MDFINDIILTGNSIGYGVDDTSFTAENDITDGEVTDFEEITTTDAEMTDSEADTTTDGGQMFTSDPVQPVETTVKPDTNPPVEVTTKKGDVTTIGSPDMTSLNGARTSKPPTIETTIPNQSDTTTPDKQETTPSVNVETTTTPNVPTTVRNKITTQGEKQTTQQELETTVQEAERTTKSPPAPTTQAVEATPPQTTSTPDTTTSTTPQTTSMPFEPTSTSTPMRTSTRLQTTSTAIPITSTPQLTTEEADTTNPAITSTTTQSTTSLTSTTVTPSPTTPSSTPTTPTTSPTTPTPTTPSSTTPLSSSPAASTTPTSPGGPTTTRRPSIAEGTTTIVIYNITVKKFSDTNTQNQFKSSISSSLTKYCTDNDCGLDNGAGGTYSKTIGEDQIIIQEDGIKQLSSDIEVRLYVARLDTLPGSLLPSKVVKQGIEAYKEDIFREFGYRVSPPAPESSGGALIQIWHFVLMGVGILLALALLIGALVCRRKRNRFQKDIMLGNTKHTFPSSERIDFQTSKPMSVDDVLADNKSRISSYGDSAILMNSSGVQNAVDPPSYSK